MAIVLYSNGILEEQKPKNLVFTEQEILDIFKEYETVETRRVVSLINTWVVFGNNLDPENFNRIASDIIQESVYSHILFIHDSEIDPKWNAADSILYKTYIEFTNTLKNIIDNVALNILNEMAEISEYSDKTDHMPSLITLGATPDKKIMFEYNPDEQPIEFYKNKDFYKFSQRVYQYLIKNKQTKEPFTIYSDKKAVIIIESKKVKPFLTSLLENFKHEEEYEICDQITKMINNWEKTKTKKPKRKTQKLDNNETE